MSPLKQGIREGLWITFAAAVLGFAFTAVTERGIFAGPPKATPASSVSAGVVPPSLIEVSEAQAMFESGEALFIDARHEFDYDLGHIKGALNIPLKDVDTKPERIASLPKDKTLITYCDGQDCNSSIELASKLHLAGYSGVKIFFGGWSEWSEFQLPTETSKR